MGESDTMKDTGSTMDAVVAALQATFEADDAIRSSIHSLRDVAEASLRSAQRLLSETHSASDVDAAAKRASAALAATGAAILKVEKAVPAGSFYRFYDMWRRALQDAASIAIVSHFLSTNALADVTIVRQLLSEGEDNAPTLPLEDYLSGACSAVSEIGRLSMNRVTVGDFATPAKCASFGSALYEAFKLLNFRNDGLRKRFDGIKYDVKRMQEIIYDLAIRGLLPSTSQPKPEVEAK